MSTAREPSTTEILREIRALRAEVAELRKPSRARDDSETYIAPGPPLTVLRATPDVMAAIADAVDAQRSADRCMTGRPTS